MPHSHLGITGQKAPDLAVDAWVNDEEFSITDNKGRTIVLLFFQSWCPGCHSRGFPSLAQMMKQQSDGSVVFAVVQTVFEGHERNNFQSTKATSEQYGFDIPFGHASGENDARGMPQIMADYRTGGTPWFVVIGKDGIVKYNEFHLEPHSLQAIIAADS